MTGPQGVPAWLHHILGKCFFVSKEGRIGLCPYGTKKGDVLAALQGARMAAVLRPRAHPRDGHHSLNGQSERRWAFIGQGFVQDWMDGKFVDGLLGPDGTMPDVFVLE